MRRVTACRELKCIREIHATLNCRPGGPQASRLKKLVNQQNKLRPEVTLTFSAPHPGFIIGVSNDYQVNLWSRRSAIDVLNDATPRGADVLEESWRKIRYGLVNDLDITELDNSIGYGASYLLDHSPSDSLNIPSLTTDSSDPDLWQLPSSAPYSNIWPTAYSMMDIEQPASASHIKENYQYTGDWAMGF
jgi:hypothetical protein